METLATVTARVDARRAARLLAGVDVLSVDRLRDELPVDGHRYRRGAVERHPTHIIRHQSDTLSHVIPNKVSKSASHRKMGLTYSDDRVFSFSSKRKHHTDSSYTGPAVGSSRLRDGHRQRAQVRGTICIVYLLLGHGLLAVGGHLDRQIGAAFLAADAFDGHRVELARPASNRKGDDDVVRTQLELTRFENISIKIHVVVKI